MAMGFNLLPITQAPVAIFWFRRDLRLDDNAGLYHALKGPLPVLPLFIFDTDILDDLPHPKDARVEFIHQALHRIRDELEGLGGAVLVCHGKPEEVWATILRSIPVGAVYTNRDYEPYAKKRDGAIADLLKKNHIPFYSSKDHVIFEQGEILKDDRSPYTVFTPYSRKWLAKLATRQVYDHTGMQSFFLTAYPNSKYFDRFLKTGPLPYPTLAELGFEPAGIPFPPATVTRDLVRKYDKTRNFPGEAGTSRLGIHFRFGTISIREKARHAQALSPVYLNELIWRDFYSQILAHFPHVVDQPFKPQYARIPWREAPEEFQCWCDGRTGYPIVDAGMRELNATGFMHNRVRMITASFLTKHLLIDWRLGEAYFAQKLLDFDLASNNGGWQWAAGCGTDAAPYFRIFNPSEQTKKFDPEFRYIRRWVPEFDTAAYPPPIVEHSYARQRCLETYKKAL